MDFGDGRRHIPRKAEVEGERRGNAPVILEEGPVDLPAATSYGAAVRLVVDAQSGHSHQQIGLGIAGHVHAVCGVDGTGIAGRGSTVWCAGSTRVAGEASEEADDPETILEGLRSDVHLVGAKIDSGVDFMLAADQIEIVLEGVDVGSTLKRGVAAIAERPIAQNLSRNQALAV